MQANKTLNTSILTVETEEQEAGTSIRYSTVSLYLWNAVPFFACFLCSRDRPIGFLLPAPTKSKTLCVIVVVLPHTCRHGLQPPACAMHARMHHASLSCRWARARKSHWARHRSLADWIGLGRMSKK
jgi:hypothetical protein